MSLALFQELVSAGIDLALTDDGRLSVPAGVLTDEQRQAIRENKAELVQLVASHQAANDGPEPTDWRELGNAYQQHSYKCPQCVAAGLGYGSRCDTGLLLWVRYGEAWELGEGRENAKE